MAKNFNVVIIDPGHGGKMPGAYRGKIFEKDLNLKVAKKLRNILKAKNIPVVMTRTKDVHISLEKRAEIANRYKNPIFVSIHFNAVEKHLKHIHGIETFYASAKGEKIATRVQKRLIRKLKAYNRSTQKREFKVLKHTKCPAILVECGFLSNPYELNKCKRSWYHSLCASAIAEGILDYQKMR